MLRFQKLVRQKKLRPSEICILYVSRGIDGSHVSRIRLDFEGELMDEWPGGFFPERIRELM
jgi:predicted ATPase